MQNMIDICLHSIFLHLFCTNEYMLIHVNTIWYMQIQFNITSIGNHIKWRTIHKVYRMLQTRLQLKRGLCWYGIIQKCTKWSYIGVHGLKIGQIFAKVQCASFLIRNILKNDNMVEGNETNVVVLGKNFEKLHGLY